MTSQTGFSLLDLMVTIGVLAIIAAIGVPSMQEAVEKRNTKAAAEEIYSQIQLAKSESIARSEQVFMNIVDGANWAIGFGSDQTCDPTDNAPVCTLPDLDNNNPITHRLTFADRPNVNVTATTNQLTFTPQRGMSTSSRPSAPISSRGACVSPL